MFNCYTHGWSSRYESCPSCPKITYTSTNHTMINTETVESLKAELATSKAVVEIAAEQMKMWKKENAALKELVREVMSAKAFKQVQMNPDKVGHFHIVPTEDWLTRANDATKEL